MIRFAAIGLDHRHIYHLIGELIAAGAQCAGYYIRSSDLKVVEGVRERFPELAACDDDQIFYDDPSISLIVCAAVPADRAAIALKAMRSGKDVLVDKPGVTTWEQLMAIRQTVESTGRIYAICFSERMIVPAVQEAQRLVENGAIGEVIQTLGLGPHRLNKSIRPGWFFERDRFGGILADIASHQIDQFLVFAGVSDAQIVTSYVGHFGNATAPHFQNFGEILMTARGKRGYIRVDWFTPDGLPAWGDGRLFILGTKGTIELRKYIDIAGRPGGNHLFLSNHDGVQYVDCSNIPLVFFRRFLNDLRDRTQTAVGQEHVLAVCRLALEAQAIAEEGQRCLG